MVYNVNAWLDVYFVQQHHKLKFTYVESSMEKSCFKINLLKACVPSLTLNRNKESFFFFCFKLTCAVLNFIRSIYLTIYYFINSALVCYQHPTLFVILSALGCSVYISCKCHHRLPHSNSCTTNQWCMYNTAECVKFYGQDVLCLHVWAWVRACAHNTFHLWTTRPLPSPHCTTFDLQFISERLIHTAAFEKVQQGPLHYFTPFFYCYIYCDASVIVSTIISWGQVTGFILYFSIAKRWKSTQMTVVKADRHRDLVLFFL